MTIDTVEIQELYTPRAVCTVRAEESRREKDHELFEDDE